MDLRTGFTLDGSPKGPIQDPDDRFARLLAKSVFEGFAERGAVNDWTMQRLIETLLRQPGEALPILFKGGTGGTPQRDAGNGLPEPDDRLPREIACAVLTDWVCIGRLSRLTAEFLLAVLGRQPGDPAPERAGPETGGESEPSRARKAPTPEMIEAMRSSAEVSEGETLSDAVAQLASFTATMRGQRVRHVRRGSSYRVVGMARLQTEVTLGDTARVVVYEGTDGSIWARPPHEMWDGRFVHEAGPVGPAVPGDDA